MPPVTDMTCPAYPSFPRRALLTIGAALAALATAAIVVNQSGPSVRDCAVAAERVMATRNYSAAMMETMGLGAVRACDRLTAAQFRQAIGDAYQIEFGSRLAHVSIIGDVPPPTFRALSAQSELRSR